MILFARRQALVGDRLAPDLFRQESGEKFKYYSTVLGDEQLENLCRLISLNQIDSSWSEYLAEIADIRESIHLKRVGGQDPFIEFQKLAIKIFDEMLLKLDEQLIHIFNSLPVDDPDINPEKLGLRAPAATWTYLVNDNPFEHNLGLQLIGDAGMQIGASILTPLLALKLMSRKKGSKLK